MSGALRVAALGGLGEFGLNLLVLETEAGALAIDCGVMFPDDSMLGIDKVIPETTYLDQLGDRLRAIVLTHGHEDHIGALPYVLRGRDIPIYGTPLTLAMVRERLRESGIEGAALRPLACGEPFDLAPFRIEALRTSHSIPDSVGLAVATPAGMVVHTGDFKLDQTPLDGRRTDLGRLAELGRAGVLLLLSDSTNAEREGITPSEREVGGYLEPIFRAARGAIFLSTFSSHLHRMQQALDLAARFGRRVVLAGRSIVSNFAIAEELGEISFARGLMAELGEARALPRERLLVLAAGSQGEPLSALARIATNDHKQVSIEPGDTVILSSRIIPGNERAIGGLINNLCRRGATVYHERAARVHVSGHASREELKIVLSLVAPRYFVPIHGEYRQLSRHVQLAVEVGMPAENCFLLEDGEVLEVGPGRAGKAERISAGRVFVDGEDMGDVGDVVLRDRRHLSEEGLVLAVLAIDQHSGEVVAGPDLVSRGFLLEETSQEVLREARAAALDALTTLSADSRTDPLEVKEQVRKALRRFFHRRLGRRPVVVPVVMEM